MTSLTRRSIVKAAPAAVIAAAAPALAPLHPDAALLALRKPYAETMAEIDRLSRPHALAEEAFYARRCQQPSKDKASLRQEAGLLEAEAALEEAVDANSAVIDKITAELAHTIEGLAFKARVSQHEGHHAPDLVASIMSDLLAMGGFDA